MKPKSFDLLNEIEKMNKAKARRAAAILGSLGGKAGRGKSKARTSDQARTAALARWGGRRKSHLKKTQAGQGK